MSDVEQTILTPDEREALDKRVLETLLLMTPLPALQISRHLGLSWTKDARELHASFLRLKEAGLADVSYGLGWYKKPQAPPATAAQVLMHGEPRVGRTKYEDGNTPPEERGVFNEQGAG